MIKAMTQMMMSNVLLLLCMACMVNAGGNEVELPVFMSKKHAYDVTFFPTSVVWQNITPIEDGGWKVVFFEKEMGDKSNKYINRTPIAIIENGKIGIYGKRLANGLLVDLQTVDHTQYTFEHAFDVFWYTRDKTDEYGDVDFIKTQIFNNACASSGHWYELEPSKSINEVQEKLSKFWVIASVVQGDETVKNGQITDKFHILLARCVPGSYKQYETEAEWRREYVISRSEKGHYQNTLIFRGDKQRNPRVLFSECGTYLSVTFPDHEGRTQVYDVAGWLKALEEKQEKQARHEQQD